MAALNCDRIHVFHGSGVLMKARVKWVEAMSFVGESGSGHSVVMDGPPESGGRDLGIRPMEMLLLGMGGCTAFDVVLILRKARQQVSDCVLEIDAERADPDPKVFTKIHVHFVVTEYGVANLFGKTIKQRVKALSEIAHPDHREDIARSYFDKMH